MLHLSYYLLCFLFNKIGEQESRTGSDWKQEDGDMAQTMYTHVTKFKNTKKRKRKYTYVTVIRWQQMATGPKLCKATSLFNFLTWKFEGDENRVYLFLDTKLYELDSCPSLPGVDWAGY
jgi:hypothetical protein